MKQVGVITELNTRQFELTLALHIARFGAVNENVADCWIREKRFQRAETECFIQYFVDKPLLLIEIQKHVLLVYQRDHQLTNLLPQVAFVPTPSGPPSVLDWQQGSSTGLRLACW